MKKSTLLLSLLITAISFSGCKKIYDYIDHNPTATCDACKIVEFTVHRDGYPTVFTVNYDKKGNIISRIADHVDYSNFDHFYRYDKSNRVTDDIIAIHLQPGALAWGHFKYISSNKIIISGIGDTGYVADPVPPFNTSVGSTAKLDMYGRVVKVSHLNGYEDNYVYDSHGNLARQFPVVYDNKINPYRTDEMWQLTTLDYSANNPLDPANADENNFPAIISYNSYGLPTKYVKPQFFYNDKPRLFGLSFDTLEIKYNCDLSKINY